jgi:hypothetical protein
VKLRLLRGFFRNNGVIRPGGKHNNLTAGTDRITREGAGETKMAATTKTVKGLNKMANMVRNVVLGGMVLLAVMALAGCVNPEDGETKNTDPIIPADEQCECTEKEHDAACVCGGEDCNCTIKVVVGGEPCECPAGTEHLYDASNPNCCDGADCACRIYYGEVVGLTNGGKNVRIYKEGGSTLTDDQMKAAADNVIAGYNALIGTGYENNLNDKISEIYIFEIFEDRNYYYKGNNILGFKFDRIIGYITQRLTTIANGNLTPTAFMNNQKNAIRLARVPASRQLVAQWRQAPFSVSGLKT